MNRRKQAITIFVVFFIMMLSFSGCGNDDTSEDSVGSTEEVVIATKNTQEQMILANLAMTLINEKTNHTAVIREEENVTSASLYEDLQDKNIDLYFDYSGSVYLNALKLPKAEMEYAVLLVQLQKVLLDSGVIASESLGYDGGLTLYMTPELRETLKSPANISDLNKVSEDLTIGMERSFYHQDTGYKTFLKAYELKFKDARIYTEDEGFYALRRGDIDIMIGSRTSVYNNMYNLFLFNDDKRFFIPATTCYFVKDQFFLDYPEVQEALAPMEGLMTSGTMSIMVRKIYVEGRDMDTFIHDFLRARNLL